jgi:hypothetical protein
MMPDAFPFRSAAQNMSALSRLLLLPHAEKTAAFLRSMDRTRFRDLERLAGTNHVVVRAMQALIDCTTDAHDHRRAEWAAIALSEERARIAGAVESLSAICAAFVDQGLDVTVMKSLDHWPDLGSDLDLYTNAPVEAVRDLMTRRFDARIAPRSLCDRLAGKWNFLIPGLPEPVEVHAGRLGQTGEQVAFASQLPARARIIDIQGHSFRVPSVSDRLIVSTLQRMYRHFYFRLCDVVDSASLVDASAIDYADLRTTAQAAGVWEGTATYLTIVSDYVRRYRGKGLDLPVFVRESARFGGDDVYFARDFLRVPIVPQSAGLYRTQLAKMLRRRELRGGARLGLLPWLATAAALGQKMTGSDKGIW